MNKFVRIGLISAISIFLVSSIAYASFLVTEIYNDDASSIDNTYNINLHFTNPNNIQEELTETIEDIEEDSYFELPHINYDSLFFDGWSLDSKKQSALKEWQTSVKDLKTNYSLEQPIKKTIDLYAVVNDVKQGMVLITVTDETNNSLKYFLKTEATETFSLFNISYVYPSTFVDIKVGDSQDVKTVNDVIDITPYSGNRLNITVSQQEQTQ